MDPPRLATRRDGSSHDVRRATTHDATHGTTDPSHENVRADLLAVPVKLTLDLNPARLPLHRTRVTRALLLPRRRQGPTRASLSQLNPFADSVHDLLKTQIDEASELVGLATIGSGRHALMAIAEASEAFAQAALALHAGKPEEDEGDLQ